MEPEVIGAFGFLGLLILIIFGVHIGIAMCLVSFIGLLILGGWSAAVNTLAQRAWTTVCHYTLSPVHTFVAMGFIIFASGIAEEVYAAARAWLARLPGSLATASTFACALLGACCGSTIAGTATMSKIAIPEMEKYGYDKALATGAIASAGPLASLIPPSILMIVYGQMTETPIGKCLMAGLLPGFLAAIVFMTYIAVRVKFNPKLAPSFAEAGWKERLTSLKGIWWVVIMFLIVIGGIYTGFFTPTEAGAVGAFWALIFAILRRTRLTDLGNAFFESIRTIAMIFFIIIGAMCFITFLGTSGFSDRVVEFVMGLHLPPWGVLAILTLFYIFLGCFMDALGLLVLTIPLVFPIITALGFDPIWFAVVAIIYLEMGLITPPVGLSVYTIKGVLPHIRLETIFRGIAPYIPLWLLIIVLLYFFPQIALFIPSRM